MDHFYSDLSDFEELDDHLDEETLLDFDPLLRVIAASGEVNFEYPDPVAIPDISTSTFNMPASTARNATDYNTARASRPLTFMSLPHDVRNKIYAMSLGPPNQVAIRGFIDQPHIYGRIVSPTNLFLASRTVYREAAAVLYGRTVFHMEHEWAIGYMTGRMGLDNCRDIRHFATSMQYVWNMQLTIRTVFPHLETLSVLPKQDWLHGPWFDLLHKRHDGYYQTAIDEAVVTSQTRAAFGLREFLEMSRNYNLIITLPFWNDGDINHRSVAMKLTMRYPKWEVII